MSILWAFHDPKKKGGDLLARHYDRINHLKTSRGTHENHPHYFSAIGVCL
jgi:hypothetical protein